VIGDTTVFAAVPYPGHPGGVAVDGDIVYTATFNPVFQALDGYDAIFAYDLATGALLTDRPNPIEVPRMMPAAVMGLAGIALDAEGRLYVADMNGRIVRVDPLTGAQEDYATFPTDSDTSFTAMPAMLTFGDDGMLYVADGSAPVIWRVPVGGGEAEVWFTDPLLPSVWGYGYAGIRIDPTGTFMYLATQYASAAAIYRFPMSHPSHDALELMHLYEPPVPSLAERSSTGGIFGAGDIAFGASGKLYAVLVGRNAVSILRPDGTEEARFPGAAEAAAQEVPYDEPIFAAFDGAGSLLVGNASFRGPNSVIFDAWVGEAALPLARPSIAG
jgi:sugar lactone lactonase YvrE